MNALQVLGLILFIVALAGVLGYLFQSVKDKEEEPTFITPEYTKEELENIKLVEELYDKDLRPIVTEKIKTKPAPELEVTEPEFVAKVTEIPQETKSEFPIDKPKKKRKYYPKKKKQ